MIKNKRKILFTVMITVLSLYGVQIYGIPAIKKYYNCPIGNEKFESVDYLPQCPENKFIIFKSNFTDEELKKYEKIINSNEYKSIPENSTREYYLAKLYELEGNFSNKEVGLEYYNAYFNRYFYIKADDTSSKESLKKGISYLEKIYLKEIDTDFDDEVFWKLMDLYVENENYNKIDKSIEKVNKKNNIEKIANFYYNMTSLDDDYNFNSNYGYINKISNPKVKRETIEKALKYINEVVKEKEKRREKISVVEFIQLARLYRELKDNVASEKLFNKMADEYWKEIVLFYLDEPDGLIGFVYTKKYLATDDNLERALSYANKKINSISNLKNSNEKIIVILLKAEVERRLGRFVQARNTLEKISLNEAEKYDMKYDFERLKSLINEKDKRVMTYIPPQPMY